MPGPFDYPLPPTAYGRAGMKQRPQFMGPPVQGGIGRMPPTPIGGGLGKPPGYIGPPVVGGGGMKPPPMFGGPPDVQPGGAPGYIGPPAIQPGGGPVPGYLGPPEVQPPGQWVDAGYGYGPLNETGMQWSEPPNYDRRQPKSVGQAGLYGVGK